MEVEALWYKDAVIYQLHVRSFFDSVGDGIGDFVGLTQKLDYLQDLGITTIWLLPFYPSPLRDDGYDIADYEQIHPQYGTMESFRTFLDAAHERGLRVVTELVINHTSDQHPWFQRARRAAPGTSERDFYVWSDTPEKYSEARIIFKDFETSNWTYDHVAKAYFWHRFYSHQPDLNYDNPAVGEAILPLLDFWFEMGVDGLRLDAVPYLYEREGTNCENLPETHAFLKALRQHVDERFPGRMLLAEANQWPEDAVAYFGDGDECHMAFHFPVMPRLFMAIHREDRFPILDIMEQTPPIPANCQWAMFLRNHDELTLEMVTDEERDYMYRAYAGEMRARINLGIRRRLTPLLSNNRRRIELMNGLLFSLPGTPVVYYGDEIGMGDNIYLGDRNGVRTPMQWSGDRNAGFSRANPQKLFLPVVIDPEYHYEAINVEAQQNNPHSLLWWMKRLIDMRKRSRALSRGTLEFLQPDNRKVLAFLRRSDEETILVVANLSRFLQYVELDLEEFRGRVPIELFGGTRFPPLGEAPFFLTLGAHTFHWFHLTELSTAAPCPATTAVDQLPPLRIRSEWTELGLRDDDVFVEALRTLIACHVARDSATGVDSVDIRQRTVLSLGTMQILVLNVEFRSAGRESEEVFVPLRWATIEEAEALATADPGCLVARLTGAAEGIVYDALGDADFARALLECVEGSRPTATSTGQAMHAWRVLDQLAGEELLADLKPQRLFNEQNNVSFAFGHRLAIKLLRHVAEGLHPDVEYGRFFRKCPLPSQVAPLVGGVELRSGRREPAAICVVHEYAVNEGDGWQYTLDSLSKFFDSVVTRKSDEPAPPLVDWRLGVPADDQSGTANEHLGEYLEFLRLVAQRTAELHTALASDADQPRFAREPFTPLYQRSIYQAMRGSALQVLEDLQRARPQLSPDLQTLVDDLLARRTEILTTFRRVMERRLEAQRIRCHGDYHLGQLLLTGKDLVIIDFEGDPRQALSTRSIKRSPLRDLAGMIRSLDYAARVALGGLESGRGRTPGAIRPEDHRRVTEWTYYWLSRGVAELFSAYVADSRVALLLPSTTADCRRLLDAFILERCLLDVSAELHHRPEWLAVALSGALDLLKYEARIPAE